MILRRVARPACPSYLILSLFLFSLVAVLTRSSDAQTAPPSKGVISGWLGILRDAYLRDLAPIRLRQACDLLHSGKDKEAAALFRAELARPQPDPIAYVGLAQAERSHWKEEIATLQTKWAADQRNVKHDDMLEFRLAVLLYYQWVQAIAGPDPNMHVAPSDYTDANVAGAYFNDLWKRDRMPLAGFMLGDMYMDGNAGFVSPDTKAICETLVKTYGGPGFYRYYLNAKHNHWKEDPPRADGVPPENQLPLSTALIGLYVKYSERGEVPVVKNGKQTWQPQPIDPINAAALRFLDGWVKNLWKAQHRPSISASSRH